jgi:hypothetical protein
MGVVTISVGVVTILIGFVTRCTGVVAILIGVVTFFPVIVCFRIGKVANSICLQLRSRGIGGASTGCFSMSKKERCMIGNLMTHLPICSAGKKIINVILNNNDTKVRRIIRDSKVFLYVTQHTSLT